MVKAKPASSAGAYHVQRPAQHPGAAVVVRHDGLHQREEREVGIHDRQAARDDREHADTTTTPPDRRFVTSVLSTVADMG
jgi:hypothetical protein